MDLRKPLDKYPQGRDPACATHDGQVMQLVFCVKLRWQARKVGLNWHHTPTRSIIGDRGSEVGPVVTLDLLRDQRYVPVS